MKRLFSLVLIFFLIVSDAQHIHALGESSNDFTVNMDVDFENESCIIGELPPYNTTTHFSNDNGQGIIHVAQLDGNKYLYLQGKKTTTTENPVIVMEDILNFKVGSFRAKFKTNETFGRKAFFIRLSDGSKLNLLEFYHGLFCLFDKNTGLGVTAEKWYDIEFRYVVTDGKTEVKSYVDDIYISSTSFDLDISTVKMDLRFHIIPTKSDNSTFMIDDIYSWSPNELICTLDADDTDGVALDNKVVKFSNKLKSQPNFLLNGRADNIGDIEYNSDANSYTVYFKEYLLKNTTYTLTVDNAEDNYGQILSNVDMVFKTRNTALIIDNYLYDAETVRFTVKNTGSQYEHAFIAVASYLNSALNEIAFVDEDIAANSSADMEFKFENSCGCLKKLFVFKGIDNIYPLINKVIDKGISVDEDLKDNVSELIMCLDSSRVKKDGTLEKMSQDNSIRVRKINNQLYIPLRYVSETFGYEVVDNKTNSGIDVVVKEGNIIGISSESNYVRVNGILEETDYSSLIVDGSYYVPLSLIDKYFGLYTLSSQYGGVAISRDKIGFSADNLTTMLPSIIYDRPTKEKVLKDFTKTNASHPRILINKERIEETKKNITFNPLVRTWYEETIKKDADARLDLPVYPYELRDGIRLLHVANDIEALVQACALAYLIEGDEKYAKRAVDEIINAVNYPSWNPDHFLDVAEMCWASAICYDWLYDYLTEEQRSAIREGIVKLGLIPGMEAYLGTAKINQSLTGAYHNRIGWKEDYSNWSFVCNGGLSVAAMAIMDEAETELCADIISRAIKSIEYPISVLAPDGVWDEGTSYWSYAMRWMSYMYESMEHTLGTSYDLYYVPGVPTTGYFPIYNSGPTGAFNVGDASPDIVNNSLFFFFADKFNDAGLNNTRLDMIEQYNLSSNWKDVIYYRDMDSVSTNLSKDSYMTGIENINMRSGWGSTDAIYVGMHGGSNNVSHGDLDLGTFIIDALGERWASDLSSDDYNLPGYWGWPERAKYYRKRAEGHNLFIVNPDENMDQIHTAEGKLLGFNSGEYAGYGVFDITSAYAEKLKSAKRAVALYDDRTKIAIQDEIIADNPVDIWWFMQTKAKVDIDEGGKSATLSIGNKRLKMLVNANTDNYQISYGDAAPLPTSPNPEGQAINNGIKRVAINFEEVNQLKVQVVFIPYYDGDTPDCSLPAFSDIDNIKKLNVNEQKLADIKEIKINGKKLPNFSSTNSVYRVKGELTKESISFTSDYDVNIEAVNDGIKLIVSDSNKILKSRIYYIKCQEEN